MLEVGSVTKFQSLPLFYIVGPTLGLIRNLGARQSKWQLLYQGFFQVVASSSLPVSIGLSFLWLASFSLPTSIGFSLPLPASYSLS
jgi:hypothetical protein